MQALAIWNPVVVSHDPTPRHVKRFYNRARLFAAYEREDKPADMTADECLVALAAMHHLDPASLEVLTQWLDTADASANTAVAAIMSLTDKRRDEPDAGAPRTPEEARAIANERALRSAWQQHIAAFNSAPSATQVRRFASRVEGILVR